MKNKSHAFPITLKLILLFSCFMLVILYNKSKAAESPNIARIHNRVAVNFKHNESNNELTISVKAGTNAIMQLFIFSTDGILIKEIAISTRQSSMVKGLKKGLYLYECFDKDERMNSGNLTIK